MFPEVGRFLVFEAISHTVPPRYSTAHPKFSRFVRKLKYCNSGCRKFSSVESKIMSFSRRDFTKLFVGAAALGLVERSGIAKVLGQSKRSMLWLSEQTASGEGIWKDLKIEGKVPRDLNGSLFRTAPGMTEKFGTQLNHLFDGDAYISSWRFREGKVELTGRYLQTPARLKEAEARRMLFNEFGTFADDPRNGGKNQPNVNIVEWNGRLLGLSETGLPSIVNPENLDFEGYEDFGKSIPDYLTFTAHPRFDSKTGDMFAWGVERRPPGDVHIYHIEKRTNKANLLYKVQLGGVFMIHDALLTENYFLLVVPPMQYDIPSAISGAKTFAEALAFDETRPTRLLVYPRDNKGGTAKPLEIEMPSEIAFHYGNAYESGNGKIVFEMVSGNSRAILDWLRNWRRDQFAHPDATYLTQGLKQVTVDLSARKILSRVELAPSVEFPRYDLRLTGQEARYLFSTEKVNSANAAIVRIDLKTGKLQKIAAGSSRTYGESVFAPGSESGGEEDGWIFTQGYDGDRNETFLEIRDAQTLEFQSRIWANGQHFSLGFHGNYCAGL